MLLKEVGRSKHLPGEMVELMRQQGLARFNMHHHTQLWKKPGAKNRGKGYGVQVAKTWYWYDRWVAQVEKHCQSHRRRLTAGVAA